MSSLALYSHRTFVAVLFALLAVTFAGLCKPGSININMPTNGDGNTLPVADTEGPCVRYSVNGVPSNDGKYLMITE